MLGIGALQKDKTIGCWWLGYEVFGSLLFLAGLTLNTFLKSSNQDTCQKYEKKQPIQQNCVPGGDEYSAHNRVLKLKGRNLLYSCTCIKSCLSFEQ